MRAKELETSNSSFLKGGGDHIDGVVGSVRLNSRLADDS
jgi:hypothetical protein